MKRLFVLTVLVALAGSAALMAQLPQPFFWDGHIVQRTGIEIRPEGQFRVDTNRSDIIVPLMIDAQGGGSIIVRGAGQVLAPRFFYPFYDPFYNGDSANQGARDQDYIDQFAGVQEYSLDSVRVSVYHNVNNQFPNFIGQLDFYRLNTDYSDRRNADQGITYRRDDLDENALIEDARYIFGQAELQGTNLSTGAIVPTTVSFDPPLEFAKNESVIAMYINDFAPGVGAPFETNDSREFQNFIGYMEYQNGEGTTENPFRNPVPNSMVHGVLFLEQNGTTTLTSTFTGLSLGTVPYATNFNVLWFGTVVLNPGDLPTFSSVRYHLGMDASDQGLSEVTPNPVRDEAVIPFSITETAVVTVELYNTDGEIVETLLQGKKYIPGSYSITLDANALDNGAYLVRMSANDKNYSTKLVIAK